MKKAAKVAFSGVGERSFQGSLSFTVADSRNTSAATDLALRAIAPYVHASFFVESFEPDASAPDKPVVAPEPARTAKQRHEHHRRKGLRRYFHFG